MILNWKEFDIHLGDFEKFLKENCPNTDGIVASSDNFEIVEKSPLTQQEITDITNHYNSLSESEELEKFNFEYNFLAALDAFREDAVLNDFPDNLTDLQKKAIFRLQLDDSEEWTIYNWYTSQ